MAGKDFEYSIVKAFNKYFEEEGVKAMAYRNKQFKFIDQNWDIYLDSRSLEFYAAIECKSVYAQTTRKIYWSSHFHGSGDSCQISRCSSILGLSGRFGWLAVEARRGKGRVSSCWFVPWFVVEHSFNTGETGLWPEQITYSIELKRSGGVYVVDDETVKQMVKYMSGPIVKRTIPKPRK